MRPYESAFLTLHELRFHHLYWDGEHGLTPVVFLPGFIANAYGALRLAEAVAPHPSYAFDLRGRGESDKPTNGYGIPQHVEDTRQRLDTLNIAQCVLVGHSFGAALSLFFAARYPERVTRLILFDGGATPSDPAFQMFLHYHQNLKYTYPSVEAYVAPYREMTTLQPWTPEAEALTRANVAEQPDGTATRVVPPHVIEAELGQLAAGQWQSLTALYPTLQHPVLLIRAGLGSFSADDRHISDEVLSTITLPHLQVYEMPQAGHTAVLTVPDAGRDSRIADFIK